MKNYSMSALIALAVSGVACAGGPDHFMAPAPPPPEAPAIEYFDGLNIGINGSFNMVDFHNKSELFDDEVFVNNHGGVETGSGGVQATFGKVFKDMYYVGLQGYGDFSEMDNTQAINFDGGPVAITTDPSIQTQAGVNVKPGIVIGADKRSLVYVLGGATWGLIQTQTSFTEPGFTDTLTQKDWKVGWKVGVGAEHFLDENGNFSVNVQYTYAQYGSVDADNNDDDVVESSETKTKDSAITLGVNYYPHLPHI